MNDHNKRSNTDKNDLRPNNIDKEQLLTTNLPLNTQLSNIHDEIQSLSTTQASLNNKTTKPPTKQSPLKAAKAKSNGKKK
ncbi:hypothetical protein RhiirA4_488177 [Rhizophagus irregularis]|uniref:Uncharacterized protein n=1 Tax=Rhizophagus irregularis TaxID=588596 RepID=A0A2I1HTE0_9GLOM|nr:hypothetical protein RhiirA4_488177 [Rhizophagus irregularis]